LKNCVNVKSAVNLVKVETMSDKIVLKLDVYPMENIIGEYTYEDLERIRLTIRNCLPDFIHTCINDTMGIDTAHRDFFVIGSIELKE